MKVRVIHFGDDDCHRDMVLRNAGYLVEFCQSLDQLERCLEVGVAPDAVIMSDGGGTCPQEAVVVARGHSSNPVILFQSTNMAYEDWGFDLIVPCLTPPEVWLQELNALISRRRAALRAFPDNGPAEAAAC